jgi:hypothetical protein
VILVTLLAQMISAKFSHELSGLLGAIKNSVEFINNPNESIKDQSVRLASLAAHSAVIRLRFFRELYGYSEEPLGLANMQRLVKDFFAEKDIEVLFINLESLDSVWKTSNHAKLLLCIAVLCQNHLPLGGEITISCLSNEVTIFACGPSVGHLNRPILTSAVKQGNISIWNVHEYYARQLADELSLRVSILDQEGGISYKVFAKDTL